MIQKATSGSPSPRVIRMLMIEVKRRIKRIGLIPFKITDARIPEIAIRNAVNKVTSKNASGVDATNTVTIKTVERRIFVRGSSLCKIDSPGKN